MVLFALAFVALAAAAEHPTGRASRRVAERTLHRYIARNGEEAQAQLTYDAILSERAHGNGVIRIDELGLSGAECVGSSFLLTTHDEASLTALGSMLATAQGRFLVGKQTSDSIVKNCVEGPLLFSVGAVSMSESAVNVQVTRAAYTDIFEALEFTLDFGAPTRSRKSTTKGVEAQPMREPAQTKKTSKIDQKRSSITFNPLGSQYTVGAAVPVSWTTSGIASTETVTLYVYKASTFGGFSSDHYDVPNTGAYDWVIPAGYVGETVHFGLEWDCLLGFCSATATSESFTVPTVSGPITVSQPTTGARFSVGQTVTVQWSAPGIPATAPLSVFLYTERFGPNSWITLTNSATDSGSYSFVVTPALVTTLNRRYVKIGYDCGSFSCTYEGESGYFDMVSVTFTSPTANSTFFEMDTIDVRWSAPYDSASTTYSVFLASEIPGMFDSTLYIGQTLNDGSFSFVAPLGSSSLFGKYLIFGQGCTTANDLSSCTSTIQSDRFLISLLGNTHWNYNVSTHTVEDPSIQLINGDCTAPSIVSECTSSPDSAICQICNLGHFSFNISCENCYANADYYAGRFIFRMDGLTLYELRLEIGGESEINLELLGRVNYEYSDEIRFLLASIPIYGFALTIANVDLDTGLFADFYAHAGLDITATGVGSIGATARFSYDATLSALSDEPFSASMQITEFVPINPKIALDGVAVVELGLIPVLRFSITQFVEATIEVTAHLTTTIDFQYPAFAARSQPYLPNYPLHYGDCGTQHLVEYDAVCGLRQAMGRFDLDASVLGDSFVVAYNYTLPYTLTAPIVSGCLVQPDFAESLQAKLSLFAQQISDLNLNPDAFNYLFLSDVVAAVEGLATSNLQLVDIKPTDSHWVVSLDILQLQGTDLTAREVVDQLVQMAADVNSQLYNGAVTKYLDPAAKVQSAPLDGESTSSPVAAIVGAVVGTVAGAVMIAIAYQLYSSRAHHHAPAPRAMRTLA